MDPISAMARALTVRMLTPSGDIELFHDRPPSGTRGVELPSQIDINNDPDGLQRLLDLIRNQPPGFRDEFGRIYPHWFDRRGKVDFPGYWDYEADNARRPILP